MCHEVRIVGKVMSFRSNRPQLRLVMFMKNLCLDRLGRSFPRGFLTGGGDKNLKRGGDLTQGRLHRGEDFSSKDILAHVVPKIKSLYKTLQKMSRRESNSSS